MQPPDARHWLLPCRGGQQLSRVACHPPQTSVQGAKPDQSTDLDEAMLTAALPGAQAVALLETSFQSISEPTMLLHSNDSGCSILACNAAFQAATGAHLWAWTAQGLKTGVEVQGVGQTPTGLQRRLPGSHRCAPGTLGPALLVCAGRWPMREVRKEFGPWECTGLLPCCGLRAELHACGAPPHAPLSICCAGLKGTELSVNTCRADSLPAPTCGFAVQV